MRYWETIEASFHLILSSSAGGANIDADQMDRKRKGHIAYEYLCHLEEAKKSVTCPTLMQHACHMHKSSVM